MPDRQPIAGPCSRPARPPLAVLFDRDGTLIADVPYNRFPRLVSPMPTAIEAVQALRAAGVRLGVITNQSGIARGLLTHHDVAAVNAEVDRIFGGFDVWAVCPHGPDDGCGCRKPRPGLVHSAAARLGLDPARVAVIGDIGTDIGAARSAGCRAVLVPTAVTLAQEVWSAELVAADVAGAVELLFGPLPAPGGDR